MKLVENSEEESWTVTQASCNHYWGV